MMMEKNNILIYQNLYKEETGILRNEYQLFLKDGFRFCQFLSLPDGQYIQDDKMLEVISKVFALRLGLIKSKKHT